MASYSDAELHEIARWLKEGLSASRIAAGFSALRGSPVSRNAIIGIVHRNAMLGAIGFANGRGMPPGVRQAAGEQAMRKPAAKRAKAVAQEPSGVHAGEGARKKKARSRRDSSPAWLPPRLFVREVGVLIADGQAYRLEVAAPQRGPIGRQPHGVAMRFIDCLFSRCRAPLDLTLEEAPENDAPGARPGADMLCCGMRTQGQKSYCDYHKARFQRRVCQ
ncbi:GcrA cell cycle regulator [Mesorhizobium sp. 43Arga]